MATKFREHIPMPRVALFAIAAGKPLTKQMARTLMAMYACADKQRRCTPTPSELAKLLTYSERTARAALAGLQRLGWLVPLSGGGWILQEPHANDARFGKAMEARK